jgi:hypothetical protein
MTTEPRVEESHQRDDWDHDTREGTKMSSSSEKKPKKCIYETILDQTISKSTPAKKVDVCGYRRYSLLARFEGPPEATFKIEINNDNRLVQQEFLQLNAAGWLNFAKEYRVFAPHIGVVIYHPPADLKVEMTLYAGL